jgi:hypothetical protein
MLMMRMSLEWEGWEKRGGGEAKTPREKEEARKEDWVFRDDGKMIQRSRRRRRD